MPPKKVSGAAAYQGQDEQKKKLSKKLEELEKENKSLKLHVAQLEENFDYRKIGTKLHIAEENMFCMMQDENAILRARICELESSQISSDFMEGDNNESDALKKLEKQLLQRDRDILELQKKLDTKIDELKEELIKKNKEICTRLNTTEVNLNVLMQDECAKLRTRINELESSQSSRLSKAMELTENNPDIADLSDFNRPTKLAERYSELYDNEWTDAFEELENNGMESRQILDELYNILKNVYIFSQKVSHDYDRNMCSSALTIPGATEEKPKTPNLNLSTRKQLVYLKKTLAPLLADDVFKLYLKQCKEAIGPKTKRFIGVCTEICWLMSVHDPPVVLDLENPNGKFDKDKYKFYQKAGKQVDFIVWPPMKLHEKGPLLAKGVAEGK